MVNLIDDLFLVLDILNEISVVIFLSGAILPVIPLGSCCDNGLCFEKILISISYTYAI